MKCTDCQLWDKKELECMALSQDLENITCLLRHILWTLEIGNGLIEQLESLSDSDEDDADYWKQ